MQTCRSYLVALSAAAIVSMLAGAAHAEFSMSRGRTRAIRAGIAAHINSHPLAHVNFPVGQPSQFTPVAPSAIRFRSKALPGRVSVVGSSERAVTWRLSSGILAGTARATTPVLANGGQLTRVSDVQYTARPRGLPPMTARQNSGLRDGQRYNNPKLEAARGHAPGTVGHDRAVRAAGFHPDSIGVALQAGYPRGTIGYDNYWSNR